MLLTTLIYLAFAASEPALPPGQGQVVVQQKCGGCHALKVVSSKRASKQQWSTLVDQMVARGADIPDEDLESVVEYLAKNFGPTKEPAAGEKDHDRNPPVNVNVNKASAAELGAELGLSPTEAAAIVAYREQNGNFKAWRELTNVPGIEATKIESNKDRLVF